MPFHNNRKTHTLTHAHTHTISLFPNPDYFLKTILTLSSFHSSCLQTLPLTSTIKKTSRIPKQKWTCRACAVTQDTTQNKRKKFKRYTPEKKKNIKGVDGKHKATSTMKRAAPVMLKDGCPSCPHHHPPLSTNPLFLFSLFFSFLLHRTDLAPLPELMELIFSLLPFYFFFLFKKDL